MIRLGYTSLAIVEMDFIFFSTIKVVEDSYHLFKDFIPAKAIVKDEIG